MRVCVRARLTLRVRFAAVDCWQLERGAEPTWSPRVGDVVVWRTEEPLDGAPVP